MALRACFWFAVALSFGAVPRAWSTPADGGTESNLGLGAGSRGIALGGAFLARVDDASAVYWNPAGLAGMQRADLSLMHAPIGFGEAAQTFVGIAYPTLGRGSFGIGFMRLGTGDIQGYDADSNPTSTFGYSESSFYLSYAARPNLPQLGHAVSVGITAKTLTQSMAPWSSTSAGLDLGVVIAPPRWPNLAVAVMWQDAVAPHPKLDQESDPIPSALHLAGSYRLSAKPGLDFDLHAGMDHVGPIGWSPRLGVECTYRDRLRLRWGGSRQGMAFGVGLGWGQFGLDYAYLGRNDAGTHPVSLRAGWGATLPQRLEARALSRTAEVRNHLQAMLDAKLASAQAAYDQGDYAAALDEWKVVAGLDPTDERVQRGMQACSARLAELQSRSLADQTEAAARAAEFELGLRYYGESDYVSARKVWKSLLAEDPHNAEAGRYLGKTETALREQVRQQAEQAQAAEAAGDWVGALASWSRVRTADEHHPEVEPALRRCRDALERPNTARPRSSGTRPAPAPAPTRSNGAATAQYRDALALYTAGELTAAVAKLKEVQKLDPDNRAAAQLLAKAERQLRPLGPEDRTRVRELYLRGMSFFTANEFDAAIAEWTKILGIDPGNTSVYKNIQEARARSSELRK